MPTEYDIHQDIKYRPLELIEAGKLARDCDKPWWNQSLCLVNESVARIGVFHGEFHWHRHDKEDELFFVLEGTLLLDVERPDGTPQTFTLERHQERSVVLMVEPATVVPVGD